MTAPYPYLVVDATNRPPFETAGVGAGARSPDFITLLAPGTPIDVSTGEIILRTLRFDVGPWSTVGLQANADPGGGGLKLEYAALFAGPYLALGFGGADLTVDMSGTGPFYEGLSVNRALGASGRMFLRLSATDSISGLGNVYLSLSNVGGLGVLA